MKYTTLSVLLITGSALADPYSQYSTPDSFTTRPNVFGGTDYLRPNTVVPEYTTRPNSFGSVNVYEPNSSYPLQTCVPNVFGGVDCN